MGLDIVCIYCRGGGGGWLVFWGSKFCLSSNGGGGGGGGGRLMACFSGVQILFKFKWRWWRGWWRSSDTLSKKVANYHVEAKDPRKRRQTTATVNALSTQHCQCSVKALSMHCQFTVSALLMHCQCTVSALRMHCQYTHNALLMHCQCSTVNTLSRSC